MHQNFNVKHTSSKQNHVSHISYKNEDFLLHFAAICNSSYLTLCVSAILFLSPLIFASSYKRTSRLTFFRLIFYLRKSSWFFMYFISFSCIQFLTFEIHIAIYLLQRCLNFVAKSFLKRYVWNVFVCILIFLLSYIFLFYCCKDRILLCDMKHSL